MSSVRTSTDFRRVCVGRMSTVERMLDLAGAADLSHRVVMARLVADGWGVCGVGDWASAWRSPDGSRVARVCPFEPAYGVFTALCRTLPEHPLLPRIDRDEPLLGGGRLTIMEFLVPCDEAEQAALLQRWDTAAPDDPITEVRRHAEELSAQAASSSPFWGGIDRNPGNVMRRPGGGPVLVDLFYVHGERLYTALLEQPRRVGEAFSQNERRYLAEIGAVMRESSEQELEAIRAAAAVLT